VIVLIGIILTLTANAQDKGQTTCQFAVKQGFNCLNHTVQTSDGYNLGLQVIPNVCSSRRGVVALLHGLLDTSETWVLNFRSQSLAFILAQNCYDVYLLNSRGNRYSPQVANWKWDWDQHAMYDLPASLDFVRKTAGISRLTALVTHSQGGAVMLAALSRGYITDSSVSHFIALSPVTYMKHQGSLLLSALSTVGGAALLKLLGNVPFSPSPSLLKKFLGIVCDVTPSLCTDISGSLFGHPLSQNVNSSRVAVYADSWPDQTSVQNMAHWLQNTHSGQFNDYSGNLYDVAKIPRTADVTVFCGGKDYLGDISDCNTLVNSFVVRPRYYVIDDYSHMDFTWSYTAGTKIYQTVLQSLT